MNVIRNSVSRISVCPGGTDAASPVTNFSKENVCKAENTFSSIHNYTGRTLSPF
jgi:hypothetical protein